MINNDLFLPVKKDFENDEEGTRCKEQAIMDLGNLYAKHGKAEELAHLVKFSRPFLAMISKAKAAKLVKSLVDLFLDMEAGTGSEVCLLYTVRLYSNACALYFTLYGLNVSSSKNYHVCLSKDLVLGLSNPYTGQLIV